MNDETLIRSEVKMEAVGKRYGSQWAVSDVSLWVRPGESYTFLGPSGCGKTTLLRMVAGFAVPDAGRIYVDDEPIDPVPPWKRNLGMVFQNNRAAGGIGLIRLAGSPMERRASGSSTGPRTRHPPEPSPRGRF